MPKLELITAMITPFKKDDEYSIDYDAAKKIIQHLVKTKSDTILIAGTSGESPTLTHEEEIELLQFTKNTLRELNVHTKIMFGAGSNNTLTAVKMTQEAQKHGADSVLLVCPYYNKPNQTGLFEHFSKIAEATTLPIVLYNVPSRTVVSLNAQTIIKLALKYPNIVGLKEASTNFDLITEIRANLKFNEFKIYSGDDSLTLPMLGIGANGVISVAAHFAGEEMREMMDLYTKYDIEAAQKLHTRLFPLFMALFTQPNPTCAKEAMGIIGLCSNKLRLPLVNLSSAEREELKKILLQTTKVIS
jgi:4-hydroxy-tetrahydrodipicolinate synthase